MKKLALLAVLLGGLILAAACGGGDNGDGAAPGTPDGEVTPTAAADGEATPTAAATEEATPTAAATEGATPTAGADEEPADSDVAGRLDELVLEAEDVPGGFNELMSMDIDMDLGFLPEAATGESVAYMSVFLDTAGEDIIVSMAFYMEDGEEPGEALAEMEDMPIEDLQEALGMMGAFGDMEFVDAWEIDVPGLGEASFGLGMTLDVSGVGTMDAQFAIWGEGPVMGIVATMAVGGSAMDVLPVAEIMADKITAALD